MHNIKPITELNQEELERIVPGYSSTAKLEVKASSDGQQTHFSLVLRNLDQPFEKRHDYSNPEVLAGYNRVALLGLSYGAFADDRLEGFILGDVQHWNSTLVIREFGVSPESRRQGIGRALLETVLTRARHERLRGVLCETQNTNLPAITLYQNLGFRIQGLDLALYSNKDVENGEVAIFLRRPIEGAISLSR